MLTENVLPNKEDILPDGHLFQLDNATVPTANISRQWFEDEGIQLLDWPAYSPYMNPIENVWVRMESILNRHYYPPADSDTLFATLRQIWNELMVDDEYRHNFINSTVNRVKCLFAAKGSYTKY